jgi:hypothetical protein
MSPSILGIHIRKARRLVSIQGEAVLSLKRNRVVSVALFSEGGRLPYS